MGLLDKVKKAAIPDAVTEPVVEQTTETEDLWVNLTDKMLRVELEDDDAYVRYAEVKEAGDKIRITSGRIIIAEVGKRGKAYKELEPYLGQTAESAVIRAKTGEYGDYYSVRLRFEKNIATVTF